MAHSRKDNKAKARVLYKGEYHKKNGMYEYRYTDLNGKQKSVYSWRLNENDPVPEGKKKTPSLRELEREIEHDKMKGVDTALAKKTTLNDYFWEYIEQRPLKQSTRTNYKYMYKRYIEGVLGNKKISAIKYSDIQRFYNSLIKEKNLKPNSMEVINTILHPIFTAAVRDDIILKNPTDGVMGEIKRSHNWSKPNRKALTAEQQRVFVEYLRDSRTYGHWKPILTVFLGTGCRVGELIGLRWKDVDFEENEISINHNLIYRQQDSGKCEYHITTPKTEAGIRTIPMLDEVRNVLLNEYKYQLQTGFNQTVVDGYSGFVFKNRFDTVFSPSSLNRAIQRIVRDYNAEETEKARVENREPIFLPHFSVHNLRHTFCTRLCENESNGVTLKKIQDIMGHSDLSTTLEVYTDLTKEIKHETFSCLQGKIMLG